MHGEPRAVRLTGNDWPDVVVYPEQVPGIVPVLQRDEPVVVGAKCGACAGVGLLFKIVDISAGCHERPHGIPALARPCDVSLGLGRFGPARQHQEIERVLAVRECGLRRALPRDLAVYALEPWSAGIR